MNFHVGPKQAFMNNTANNTRRIKMRDNRQGVGSALLFLAFFLTFQILPSMRALPIDCQKNTAVCLEEIMKELTQVRFEVNILLKNRTSLRSKNCAELYKSGQRVSGVYTIDPDGSGAFNVYCDQTTTGGGWTVIQKRMDGSVDFNRSWDDYKHGFGNLVGEFWLGLDKINRLTQNKTKNKLRVDLGVKTGKTVYSEYGWFGIGTETAKYWLDLGKIIDATVSNDSLGPHKGFVFGTWDKVPAGCAQQIGGGWWYDSSITQCAVSSNLNGIYPRCGKETLAAIHWGYLGRSAKRSAPTSTEIKIRPVEFMRVA